MSQKQKVRDYLESGRPLTSWEAIEKWRITRLAAIIDLLKKEGMNIVSEMKKNFNTGKKYAEYRSLDIRVNESQTSLFEENENNELPKAQHLDRF